MPRDSDRSAHDRLTQAVIGVVRAEPNYQRAARQIRAAERRYTPEAHDEDERRGIRALVALLLFTTAMHKRAAFRTVEQRYCELMGLNNGNLLSEVAASVDFAHHCGQHDRVIAWHQGA